MCVGLNFQPKVLWSSTKVLSEQRGNCFDYSILLASLLIGSGYDAYVVSGYATKEICNMDQSRKLCPLIVKSEEKKVTTSRKEIGKYSVKAQRDLNSKYLHAQEQKRLRQLADEAERRRVEHERYLAELEKPKADPLHGLRVHAWVMVLSGKREVAETFFIEALSGEAIAVPNDDYLGVESVWNHKNYWVNMQSCESGTSKLVYDLGDSTKWEYMLPSNEKPSLLIPKLTGEGNEDEVSLLASSFFSIRLFDFALIFYYMWSCVQSKRIKKTSKSTWTCPYRGCCQLTLRPKVGQQRVGLFRLCSNFILTYLLLNV